MGYPSIYVSATHGPSLETRGLPVDTDGPPMGHHINAWGIHALRMECPWDAHGLLTLLGLQTRFGDNWGKITWNLSGLSPKRGWNSKGAKVMPMKCPWDAPGLFMGKPWVAHGWAKGGL